MRVKKSNELEITDWLKSLGYEVEQIDQGLRVNLENDSVFIKIKPALQGYQIIVENLPEFWIGDSIDEFKADWNDLLNYNRRKLNEAQLILKRHRIVNVKGYAARQRAKRRKYLKEIY